jgi:uncharacterized protein (TIGR02118 family)
MSYAYLVIYEGKPDHPEEFLRYYIERHLPIVWTFPKARRVEVERGVDESDIFLIGRVIFDTLEDLRAALASPQREKARADMAHFPSFKGTVRRQAVEVIEVPHR